MMGIFQTNSIPVRELDKLKGRELGAALYPQAARWQWVSDVPPTFPQIEPLLQT